MPPTQVMTDHWTPRMELYVNVCSGEVSYVFVGGGPTGEGWAGANDQLSGEGRESAEEVSPQLLMGAGSQEEPGGGRVA